MLRKVEPILGTALLLAGCFIADHHRSVTKEMGWQCTGLTDTKYERFPHLESIKMWFLESAHYEERATGPHLCADLEQSGKPTVAATFDFWGNGLQGLHGYNLTSIDIGSRKVEIYEGGEVVSTMTAYISATSTARLTGKSIQSSITSL